MLSCGVSIDSKYGGCLDERACQVIVHLIMILNHTRSQSSDFRSGTDSIEREK